MKRVMYWVVIMCFVAVSLAEGSDHTTPPQKEKCPVCGMFVSMFADWNARIEFKDSTRAIFDGSKDMFKYYLDVKKYNSSKSKEEVTAVIVKDYYTKIDIDALQAFFVIWSDVYGPMGHEPIPFEKEADAKKFMGEHKGKDILRFKDISMDMITSLDNP
jgi:nitrous oxide reductase accessory protein NosL